MKHIIFLLLFLPALAYSQGGTWPIKYNDSDPSGAPSAAGTRLYINTATNTLFTWEPAPSSTWRKQPKAFDQISGCAAPAYTPTARQSTFAVNSCTPPELYQYTGSAWECLNCVEGLNLTAGAGITLSGTAPDITISAADESPTNELNTSLSVSGSNLQIIDAGGTLTVPVSSIAPVQAVAAGAGISISGTTTRTIASTITQADGSETKINVGTGLSKSGSGTTGSPYVLTNTAPNVVQTLSIDGSDLSLSGGGGTVTLPGGADGNGIYSGSGTIPDSTSATLAGLFDFNITSPVNYTWGRKDIIGTLGFTGYRIDDNNFSGIGFDDRDLRTYFKQSLIGPDSNYSTEIYQDGIGITFRSVNLLSPGSAQFSAGNGGFSFSAADDFANEVTLSVSPTTMTMFDNRPVKKGIEYGFYYPEIETNPQSLTDVQTVQNLIANNWPLLAPNGSVSAPSYSFLNSGSTGMYLDGGGLQFIAGEGLSFVMQAGSGVNGGAWSAYAGNTSEDEVQGGRFTLQAGNATGADASGGGLDIIAGNGQGSGNTGGSVTIQGGLGTAQGGNVDIFGGNGPTNATDGKIQLFGNGVVLPRLTTSERNALSGISTGTIIYNTDATANDSSTGVMQVYNGTTWKNAW